MTNKLISQGAEAKLFLNKSTNLIKKERIAKNYRYPELDLKLRKHRTKREVKILEKASSLIPVPNLSKEKQDQFTLSIDYIEGKKLSEHLDNLKNSQKICKEIGQSLAILHDNNIIHGDLTTSNLIYNEKEKKTYFIDFGLSFISTRIEDKAVDLQLIKQALEAKHNKKHKEFFNSILEGYKKSENYKETLQRLQKVEARGRYKQQF